MRGQLERFVDLSGGRGLLVDNREWLGELRVLDFLRDVGKHFTVNQMVAKESVKSRFEGREQGISYTEFSYMLLQAYDFLYLRDAYGCRLQFGGSDQWGNITMGVELIRKLRDVQVEPDTPLLWAIREQVGLTGTKYGCGVAQCGACSVHVNGELVRSCVVPVGGVKPTDKIVTIEGLSSTSSHPVQKAWAALDVPQCGYCQSGQIMAAAALLRKKPKPTDQEIDDAMSNVCRCGTYQRIRAAVHVAAGRKQA